MNVQERIKEALNQIMDEGEANACRVYKCWDYDRAVQAYGWYYKLFNGQSMYLGKNVNEALETIEDIASSRE